MTKQTPTRRLSKREERDAWTRVVLGKDAAPGPSKYSNERAGKYASKHEADVATKLYALEKSGQIRDLREQDRIVLVPGRDKVAPVIYVADFTYTDSQGVHHVLDAKGFKTQVYKVKKRLAYLLLNITIEEV